jgi:hypothetical protein
MVKANPGKNSDRMYSNIGFRLYFFTKGNHLKCFKVYCQTIAIISESHYFQSMLLINFL